LIFMFIAGFIFPIGTLTCSGFVYFPTSPARNSLQS
jgi:hypothetical protein